MALFVLTCTDKPDALDLRLATREAHFAYLKAQGCVRLGGPFLDEAGNMVGSMMVIEAADLAAAEAFADNDPYKLAGLFAQSELRPWKATVGEIAPAG